MFFIYYTFYKYSVTAENVDCSEDTIPSSKNELRQRRLAHLSSNKSDTLHPKSSTSTNNWTFLFEIYNVCLGLD